MGRTRARRERNGGMSNEALIKIIGAPSIVPSPFTAVARKDQNWYAFLAENGLQVKKKIIRLFIKEQAVKLIN